MIFVTTGTQEPFDRLLAVIVSFAKESGIDIVVQGKTEIKFPSNVLVKEFLSPMEFDQYFQSADFIVSHAGMGTIISALERGKKLVVFPRIASLGEHRNEHQMATANKMSQLSMVDVAFDDDQLLRMLRSYIGTSSDTNSISIGKYASKSLLESIEEFLEK